MKAYVFSLAPVEEAFAKDWQDQHPDDVLTVTHQALTLETADLAKGYDAVSTQPERLSADLFKKLASNGVKHVALRKVGVDHVDLAAAKDAGIAVSNVPAYSPPCHCRKRLDRGHVPLEKVGLLPPADAAGQLYTAQRANERRNF